MPTRHPFLAVVLPAILAVASPGAATGQAAPTVDQIVARYLATVRPERFDRPHTMEYRRDMSWPREHTPSAYVERIDITHRVSPPCYRTDGKIGPVKPNGVEEAVYSHVWNGQSEANLYDYQFGGSSMTIKRNATATEEALANLYLNALGFARMPKEREEATHGLYWLPGAVSEDRGYRVAAATEDIDGVACVVIRRGIEDALWFDCRGEGARLRKRDVWRGSPFLRREVVRFPPTGADLPPWVEIERHVPSTDASRSTDVEERERITLTSLRFGPPGDVFAVVAAVGTRVMDLNTKMTFVVQPPDAPPFDELIRKGPKARARSSYLLWFHLLAAGAVLLVFGLRCWPRVRPASPSTSDQAPGLPRVGATA